MYIIINLAANGLCMCVPCLVGTTYFLYYYQRLCTWLRRKSTPGYSYIYRRWLAIFIDWYHQLCLLYMLNDPISVHVMFWNYLPMWAVVPDLVQNGISMVSDNIAEWLIIHDELVFVPSHIRRWKHFWCIICVQNNVTPRYKRCGTVI